MNKINKILNKTLKSLSFLDIFLVKTRNALTYLLSVKTKKINNLFAIFLVFIVSFNFLFFPAPAFMKELAKKVNINLDNEILGKSIAGHEEYSVFEVKKTSFHAVTAYNSDPYQTDDTPCITANGFNLCDHGIEDTIATNFLPFGTKIRIPELFGDRIFVVRDRMNARYKNNLDIWMKDKADAKKFGIKRVQIEILK
jgi:3D (Asp-Asp-Asp) domain-containing protein